MNNDYRMKVESKTWIVLMIFMYTVHGSLIVLIIELFPAESGKTSHAMLVLFQKYPCLYLLSDFPYFYAATMDPIPGVGLPALAIFAYYVFYVVTFCVGTDLICITHSFYILRHSNRFISEHRRKMQKKFLITLCLQLSIPVLILGCPWIYFGSTLVFSSISNATHNNFLFGVLCTHGFISSLFLITVNEPYRHAVISIILRNPAHAHHPPPPVQLKDHRSSSTINHISTC
ncbi:unnamed protein product, partial [Mesorhabditis belari]|uniref:Serpentine Receptor, class H n=1 Tax=Mesorhabditis belari TaxID=2138241 RepID=A0AAF3FBJ8_9BILA